MVLEDLFGVGVDPGLVDVRCGSGLAVSHHSRDRDAVGASPMIWEKLSTISPTTSATFFGVDFCGVVMRSRLEVKSPVARSTGAPLMPLPPMSMPRTGLLRTGSSLMLGA